MSDDERQRDLFDPVAADKARDASIEQVRAHADTEWKKQALIAIAVLAVSQPDLTTDDVWARLGKVAPDASTHEPRALGAVMQDAKRLGYIEPVKEWRQSTRVACHGRPVQVWRSLRYRPGTAAAV